MAFEPEPAEVSAAPRSRSVLLRALSMPSLERRRRLVNPRVSGPLETPGREGEPFYFCQMENVKKPAG